MKFTKTALKILNHRELKPVERQSMKKIAKKMALYLGQKEVNRKIIWGAMSTVGLSGIPFPFSYFRKTSYVVKLPRTKKYMGEMQKPKLPNNLTEGAKKALYLLISLKMHKQEITEKEYNFYLDIAEILRQRYNRDKITVKEIIASETASALVFNA